MKRTLIKTIADFLNEILDYQKPSLELCSTTAIPPASDMWSFAEDILPGFPPGDKWRKAIVGVFLRHLKQNPEQISRLHPATVLFHLEFVNEMMKHPKMTEDLRSKMLENPEITAVLL